MTKYDLYWKTNPEWYNYTDDEDEFPQLTDAAPTEARESFARYLEEKKRHKERREALAAELEAKQREKRDNRRPLMRISPNQEALLRGRLYIKKQEMCKPPMLTPGVSRPKRKMHDLLRWMPKAPPMRL